MLAMRHAVRRLGKASKRFQRRTAAAVKLQAAFRALKARKLAGALRAERDWELLVSRLHLLLRKRACAQLE